VTAVLDIAVIGHTNTGKTSLLRTLTRRRDFGVVSARPATTRHVEMAELAADGRAVVRLYDTPGLEDSSGLLAHMEQLKTASGQDWIETIQAFTTTAELQAGFAQEVKALKQVLASDVIFYVIDARDPVRAKHRDELELLGRCARPVLPVLNFVASDAKHEAAWRDQLARVNMHAVVAFDTVVFHEAGELSLYTKIATLADRFAPLLDRLIADLAARRAALKRASAVVVAELIVDVTAARRTYTAAEEDAKTALAAELQDAVRQRERQAVAALLDLNRFDQSDYLPDELPFAQGEWKEDIFDPAVLERFGLSTGSALATGAAAGLAIDFMTGGMSLGAAALTGAGVGLVIDNLRRYGGRLKEMASGIANMRVAEPTLDLLIERETALLAALLKRGHGAQDPIRRAALHGAALKERLSPLANRARRAPAWSVLSEGVDRPPASAERRTLIENIADVIEAAVAAV
jgi:GTPase Era involved in 16S rRNA processing